MKVIFLDFDGVLNSSASFIMESRKTAAERGMPVNKTLDRTCCSNFQYILDKTPGLKIVISSTWRELFELDWLKEHLKSYGIDSSLVIDKTPSLMGRGWDRADRGEEINAWLKEHPEVTKFVVLDDNYIGDGLEEAGKVVATSWTVGLTLDQARAAIAKVGGHSDGRDIPL